MAGKIPQSGLNKKESGKPPERKPLQKKDKNRKSYSIGDEQQNIENQLLEKFMLSCQDIFFVLDSRKRKVNYLRIPFLYQNPEINKLYLPVNKEEEFLTLFTVEDVQNLWQSIDTFSTDAEEEQEVFEMHLQEKVRETRVFKFTIIPHNQDKEGNSSEWIGTARDVSDTKEQLEKIEKYKRKLQMVQEKAGLGTWSFDAIKKKMEFDPQAMHILGIKAVDKEVEFSQVYARIYPEDQEGVLEVVENSLTKAGRFKHDFRLEVPDSVVPKHVEVVGESIAGEQAGVKIVTGICQDISRNVLEENKIKISEAFLEESQRIARIGCFDWDLELDKVNLTSQMYSILDISSNASLQLAGFFERVHPKDRAEVENILLSTIKNGGGFSKEFRYFSTGGKMKILWAQGQVKRNDRNRSTKLVGTIQDISEKKEKEKELYTQNLIIRSILDNLPVIIRIIDKQGVIRSLLGEAGLSRIGMRENQTVGQNILKEGGIVSKYIRQVLKGKTVSFTEELEYNGRTLFFLNYFFYNEERELAIGFSIDVSAQKQTEAAFQQVSAKNRELERMNKVMDMFVYATAHDLKNPINNLEMLSILLEEVNSKKEQAEYLEALRKAIQRLKQTINGLTEIIGIESSQGLLSSKLKFREIMDHVMADLEPLLKEKNGKIVLDFQVENIRYNEAFLTSILKNLISNAIKYSDPQRPPIIKISTEKKNGYVLLSVQDNGIGIDLQQSQFNLFKPFKRFTKQAEGTGIGLYLIKNMVEKNGGYLEIESTLNQGTNFYCYLMPFF